MDWDSPTTKKHIAEAQAQGCELLGPGKDYRYRRYRLPCGHEKEVQTGNIRRSRPRCDVCTTEQLSEDARQNECKLLGPGKDKNFRVYRLPCGHQQEIQTHQVRAGGFICRTCLDERLAEEAREQNCELIGPGRSKDYRTYMLPCGHKAEFQLIHMRNGGFRCATCFEDQLIADAEKHDCVLLGPGTKLSYRKYRLACGHECEIQFGHMHEGNFQCSTCTEKRFEEEALNNRCELIGPSSTSGSRLYMLDCGHQQEVSLRDMRNGTFRCRSCIDDRLESEAQLQECELIGLGKHYLYRLYRLPCGHTQEIQKSQVRHGGIRCQTCQQIKLEQEAEARGCKLIGEGRDAHYRIYRLKCSHEQEIGVQKMRNGIFRCQSCEEYAFTLPASVYLLYLKLGPDQWLKLGYTNNLEARIDSYGLPEATTVDLLGEISFDTGLEAARIEKALHTKHSSCRLDPNEMMNFHKKSGATECYPVTMLETLLAELKDIA